MGAGDREFECGIEWPCRVDKVRVKCEIPEGPTPRGDGRLGCVGESTGGEADVVNGDDADSGGELDKGEPRRLILRPVLERNNPRSSREFVTLRSSTEEAFDTGCDGGHKLFRNGTNTDSSMSSWTFCTAVLSVSGLGGSCE
jgi:hypothetical protein